MEGYRHELPYVSLDITSRNKNGIYHFGTVRLYKFDTTPSGVCYSHRVFELDNPHRAVTRDIVQFFADYKNSQVIVLLSLMKR